MMKAGPGIVDIRDLPRSRDQAALVAAAAERFGRLDYLVNNAGMVTMTPFLELPEEE